MTSPYQDRPVSELKVHPLNKTLPAWAEDDPRFRELCASIQECGVQVPLIADGHGQVIDGAHRLRAAKRVGLSTVPVILKSDDEVATTIVTTLIERKHYTKGQLAYICAPHFDRLFAEAKARRASSATPSPLPKTSEMLADRLGICERTLRQARELHKLFADSPEYKAHMEPQILAAEDPVGLGAAIAGYAGWMSTKGKPKADARDPEQLWMKGFNGLLFQTGRIEVLASLKPRIEDALADISDFTQLHRLEQLGREIATQAARRLKAIKDQ